MKIHKIVKNIPVPKADSRTKYPWHGMEKGDSVLIEPDKGQSLETLQNRVNSSLWHRRQMTGKRFRTMIDHKNNGVRVWRIE